MSFFFEKELLVNLSKWILSMLALTRSHWLGVFDHHHQAEPSIALCGSSLCFKLCCWDKAGSSKTVGLPKNSCCLNAGRCSWTHCLHADYFVGDVVFLPRWWRIEYDLEDVWDATVGTWTLARTKAVMLLCVMEVFVPVLVLIAVVVLGPVLGLKTN